MLIRINIKNLFSFGEMKEFNMIPSPKFRRMSDHKYQLPDFEILKLSSIYGANAAGKSNLIKSFKILQDIIVNEKLPKSINDIRFKFVNLEEENNIIIGVEYFQEEKFFIYSIEIGNDIIINEELYESGLGKKDDLLIFERKTDDSGNSSIKFFEDFEKDKESTVLKNVIEKNLCKPNKPIFKLLTTLNNPLLDNVKIALTWFEDTLQIISPNSKPKALAHKIDSDKEFYEYAKNIMCSFHVGISDISSECKDIRTFFGEDNPEELDNFIKEINDSPKKVIGFINRKNDEEIVIIKENNDIMVKRLNFVHKGKDGISATFRLYNESDGTKRLLDFIPAFKDVISNKKVYVIDEIERSIHPLLIKELVNKFSLENNSNGQLIFSTHESNLLDQEIFRLDEIWFAEKDNNGCTDLYSLSDYKEHSTIDIRKGYLNGRYGSIPFLGNLKDLNWHKYDSEK